MMRKVLILSSVAFLFCISQASFADTIGQNQPSGPSYMAAFAQTDLAQSFKQTHDNITGAGILLQPDIGTTDNVTISLWDALPNAGGSMLATASAMGTQGQWIDVFWDYTTINPAATYYLVFTGNTLLGIAGDINNPYPFGCVYANSGFGEFLSYDYAFRTWYDAVAIDSGSWSQIKALF